MNNQIKAICFDLDGVYFTPRGKQSFHDALSTEFGAKTSTIDKIMYRSNVMRKFVTGNITPTDFWEYLRNQTRITANDNELLARWIRDYEIDPEVQKSVQTAKKQGFMTCICTNNNAARLPALDAKFDFFKDFDVVISSHEVGYVKPNREIFLALLDKAKLNPEELIYSDDNPDRLQGARDLGINVFTYKNFPQFLQELKSFGIYI